MVLAGKSVAGIFLADPQQRRKKASMRKKRLREQAKGKQEEKPVAGKIDTKEPSFRLRLKERKGDITRGGRTHEKVDQLESRAGRR